MSISKLIAWNNGTAMPAIGSNLSKEQFGQLTLVAASLPYRGEYNPITERFEIDPRYDGMTNAEVMNMRLIESAAAGSLKATEMVFDRILGKPKQAMETVSLKMSYSQYLDYLSGDDQPSQAAQTVETTFNPPTPTQSIYDRFADDDDDLEDVLRGL